MDREKQDWQEWERNLDGFTQRVDDLIKKSGKTQKQIAAELGMTQSTFTRWKHAYRKGMSAYTVWRMAKALGASVDYLLFGRSAISKRRPLPPVREYQTLGGAKRDTSDTRDERRPGSLPLG